MQFGGGTVGHQDSMGPGSRSVETRSVGVRQEMVSQPAQSGVSSRTSGKEPVTQGARSPAMYSGMPTGTVACKLHSLVQREGCPAPNLEGESHF